MDFCDKKLDHAVGKNLEEERREDQNKIDFELSANMKSCLV
jgi:hypothetical protein